MKMGSDPLRVLVMASGKGSNFEALTRAIDAGRCQATVVRLVTDRPNAGAIAIARRAGIDVTVVARVTGEKRSEWGRRLAATMDEAQAELIVLAGFMRVLDPQTVARFAGRIINVHPALLPSFPGLHAVEQALEAGVRVSGCTVHIVDDGVDSGPILAQGAVEVLPDDDAEALHRRIQRVEHELLPNVVDWIARGLVSLAPSPRYVATATPSGTILCSPALVESKTQPTHAEQQ